MATGAALPSTCAGVSRKPNAAGRCHRLSPYRTAADLRQAGHDALAVLSLPERAHALLAPGPPPGPAVAISRQVLLARAGSPLRRPGQLAGHRVCFIIASPAEAALNAWTRSAGVEIVRAGFQEPVELRDAFDAGYCAAMTVDAADIPGGAAHVRPLGPPLSEVRVFAIRARM